MTAEATVLPIIAAVAFCHMLNDLMQSLIPAIYPMLKTELALTFGQIGLITFVFQGTASLLAAAGGHLSPTGARCPIRWSSAWA